MYARRTLPATPFARLTGFGIGHVSTGSLTGTLKASAHLIFPPAYNLTALSTQTLYACASTAVDAGVDVDPITISVQYFRPPRPQPGNFLARARVLNSSSAFVSCTAELEDPVGRLVGFAASQWGVRRLDPPPPAAPASIERADDAVYSTPDPPDRPSVGGLVPADMQARYSGLEVTRMIMAGELPPLPLMHTCGARWVEAEEGFIRAVMPASDWFCSSSRSLDTAAIESLLNIASTYAALDLRRPGALEPERVLATLLFTDIVGSTLRAERMGDGAWRSLLDQHHTLVRRELGAHRGREVKTIGDGFLARFDTPASALQAARAIRDSVHRLGLEVRAGVHTGECEVHGADLAGIAVHVAARIVALAGPSEILVSQTVRDLAAGSGIHFAARGKQQLRGVEGEYELFAVEI